MMKFYVLQMMKNMMKNSPLDNSWIGYHTTYGFQLLHSYPIGKPISIPPPEFSHEDLKDIPSMYQFMDENNQNWWKSFFQDQKIIQPSKEYMTRFDEDFWLNINDHQIDEDIQIDIEEETSHHVPITIPSHPLVNPEIEIGSIIAVISDDKSTYWIEKVKHCKRSKGKMIHSLLL